MPRLVYDLDPVTHITADAIGPPGQRIFYVQAAQGSTLVTLLVEKEQVQTLAASLERILDELDKKYPRDLPPAIIPESAMGLLDPIEPAFRVGQLGLGYDEKQDMIVLIAYELTDDLDNMLIARFWATRAQMRAFSRHGAAVCAAGRPLCPLCREPIDPQGHFCPRSNGRRR
jgi:uncharacterized repeat protein (TIGR03847 family)